MKINKRFLQFIAAFMILVFHLWMPVSHSVIELYLVRIGYIGVDIFFFLSAYSLADKEIDYKSFFANRIVVLYLKFVFFVVLMAAISTTFRFERIWKNLLFVELFERGGGAFLWFLPAILLFYFLYPLFVKWDNRWKILIIFLAWMMGTALLQWFGYTTIFIFTNRIPIMLIGYTCKKHAPSKYSIIPLLLTGLALLYFWGFTRKLHVPVRDSFYFLAIPVIVALAALSMYIKENGVWRVLGSATLELYALQMIFGTKIVSRIYTIFKNTIVTNVCMIVCFFTLAFLLHKLFHVIENIVRKMKISGERV